MTAGTEQSWGWLEEGWKLVPAAVHDLVLWSYEPMERDHVAFTTGIRPLEVTVEGEKILADGVPTRVDPFEVRAKAHEQARRLFSRLA